MYMQFSVTGFGVGYRFVSVSVDKTAILYFRDAYDESDYALEISDSFAAGQKGPNVMGTLLASELVNINESKHQWLFDPTDLIGRQAAFQTSGTSLVLDQAVINATLKVLDEKHQFYEHKLDLKHVPVTPGSWQTSGFSVKGTIRRSE